MVTSLQGYLARACETLRETPQSNVVLSRPRWSFQGGWVPGGISHRELEAYDRCDSSIAYMGATGECNVSLPVFAAARVSYGKPKGWDRIMPSSFYKM